MCLHTLYVIFGICISVQGSLENDVDDAKYRMLLKPQHHAAEPSYRTAFMPTRVEKYEDCDKAVTLQKILGVMMSLLRQDISEYSKTAYVLETLKDLLKNTAGSNSEVMYKIDDLMRTLEKYRDDDSKGKKLRAGLDNANSPMKILVREPTQINQKIRLNYDLPVLTNSYCTEALLNVIKIAYKAYVSLAKNPICNLPALPEPSGSEILDINPSMPDFLKPIPNFKPQSGVVNNLFANNLPPFLLPELQPDGYPSNPNTNNFVPNVDIFNTNSEKLPVEYKPVYEYLPNVYDGPIDNSQWPVIAPQIPNELTPDHPEPYNPMSYIIRPEYLNYGDNKIPLHPYLPHNPDVLPFDFTPLKPEDPFYPYNEVPKLFPELNPQRPTPFPWQKNKPYFPFDAKSNSNSLNPYYPDANNPLIIPKVPVPFPFINPQQPIPVSTENPEVVLEFPLNGKSDRPNTFPFQNEINPALINALYPYNLEYPFPRPLPNKPGTETPRYMPPNNYSPNSNPPAEIDVFEFPYQADTPKPNNVFPVNHQVNYPNNPSDLSNSPETKTYEFNLNPNDLEPAAPPSPSYPFMPYNPTQEYKFNPNKFNPYAVQNPAYEFELNSDRIPVYPHIPNPPYDWTPKSPAITPQDFNPFFSKPVTPPNTPQEPELKVIGFIREAIDLIEGMIPVMKFDPPTLYIIAKIKDILVQKDIEADEYANILELYKKLINYVKQLNVYKQIIDLIDLPRVTNGPKLETKKVVELTYLVKRPQPVVYYPYYYVKYRLPYPSFVVAAQNLLREKPHLRMNPNALYDELLALSKVAETSPDLKTYGKKEILGLTFKSGSLVHAKLVGENGTLAKKLNALREITSDLTAEEILKLNKEATNQITLLSTPSETVNDQHIDKNKSIKTDYTDAKQEVKQQISSLTPGVSLSTNFLANNDQNDLLVNPTTEPTLEFTSFESAKLRSDILRGEYVGLPFSDYTVPTNVNPLYGLNEPIFNNRGPIAPAMYKLLDATFDASKSSNLRNANQQNFMNSGGLANLDNEHISLNTGKDNHQASINISNSKIMINSAETPPNLLNMGKTRTNLDVSSQQSMINAANTQLNHQASVNRQNMWTNQQNYYNSGGLVNFDNQRISLNTGTGNSQDGVNFINPKVMFNKATDLINEHTRTTLAPDDSMNLKPISDLTRIQGLSIADLAQNRVTSQKGSNNAYVKPTESYEEATTSQDDLFYFGKKGLGIPSQKGNMNDGSPNNIIELTTRRSFLDDGVTQSPPSLGTPDKEEMANLIKNSVKEDVRQFENAEDTKILDDGDRNKRGSYNNYYNIRPWNSGINMPSDSHNPPNGIVNNFLIKGNSDIQYFHKNKKAVDGAANQDILSFDDSKVVLGTETGNTNNAVSPNNNKWFQQSVIGNQGLGYDFASGMADQQGYERDRQQNFLETVTRGLQSMSSQQNYAQFGITPGISSQQNFAHFGINPGFSGRQINSYVFQNVPIIYKRPVIERLSLLSSPMPLVSRFTRPRLLFG